jgi:hypothetical protein
MTSVVIHGWEKGLKTISLMHLLVRETGVSMQEAKRLVEELVAGQKIELKIKSVSSLEGISNELSDIGACYNIKK